MYHESQIPMDVSQMLRSIWLSSYSQQRSEGNLASFEILIRGHLWGSLPYTYCEQVYVLSCCTSGPHVLSCTSVSMSHASLLKSSKPQSSLMSKLELSHKLLWKASRSKKCCDQAMQDTAIQRGFCDHVILQRSRGYTQVDIDDIHVAVATPSCKGSTIHYLWH